MRIRFFRRSLVLFSTIVTVLCKISPEDINEVIQSLELDESRNLLIGSSIANPIYGHLFEATGAFENIRFFGPLLRIEKNNNHTRNFANDSSDEDLVKIAILLFPSPTGTLCHIRNIESNFGSKIKQKIKEGTRGIHFMGELFVKVLNNELFDIEITNSDEIDQVKGILLNENKSKVFSNNDTQLIKLMMIHSFIINLLDDKNHLKEYFSFIVENIKNLERIPHLNADVIDHILRIKNHYLGFPYSKINQPPSNSKIPVYDREKKKFLEDVTFSDCADVLLLNLCNCLLYDPVKLCYSTDNLHEDSDICKFYQKYNKLYTITDEIRNDWSKVIQGLDDFTSEDKSKYKLNKIVYLMKGMRNEVKSGIINMMNILIKICNIDHENFWKDFKGIEKINEKLLQLFNQISTSGSRIWIVNCNFKEERIEKRMEIIGSFDVIFERENGIIVVITVEHSERHAQMKVSSYGINSDEHHYKNTQKVKSNDLLETVYMNYVTESQSIEDSDIIKTIYFSEPLQTDEQKLKVLKSIFKFITENENQTIVEILKGITISILDCVDLTDMGTRVTFLPYLVYFDGLTDSEIIECWVRSLENDKEPDIDKLWEPRVLKTKLNEIDLNLDDIKSTRKSSVFNILSEMKHIQSLILKGNLNDKLENTLSGLSKLTQLKKLNIRQIKSGNPFNIEQTDLLSDSLSKLKNLKSLYLSLDISRYKEKDYAKIILTNLTHLTELKISLVCFIKVEVESLSKVLLKLTNLTSLYVSFEEGHSDGFLVFTETLGKMDQLTELRISNIRLDENKKDHLANALLQLKNLKTLYFSHCELTPEGLHGFAEKLGKLTRLRELGFSNIDSGENWIYYLVDPISKLTNLTTLDFSNNFFVAYDELVGLLQGLMNLKNLKTLNILSFKFSNQGIDKFTKVLGNLTQLTELNMSDSSLNDQDFHYIITAIGKLKNLSTLNITNNYLNPKTLAILMKTLRKLTDLRLLAVSVNESCTAEIESFSKQLGKLTQLQILEISTEILRFLIDRKYIFEAVRKLRNLTILNIRDAFIEINDTKKVVCGLKDLKYLNSICIHGFRFNHETLKGIAIELPNVNISSTN